MDRKPRFELDIYRQFIREASSYVSLIAGRRIKPAEADLMSDNDLTELALKIDERVATMKPLGEKN